MLFVTRLKAQKNMDAAIETPRCDFDTFTANFVPSLAAIGYESGTNMKRRFVTWGNGRFAGWLHVAPVSGFSIQIARIAIYHYALEGRFRRFASGRGGLQFKIEGSIHREELIAQKTANWLAGYVHGRHNETAWESPPFAMSKGFCDLSDDYWWSRSGVRRADAENLTWDCNRARRLAVIRGDLKLPDFSAEELAELAYIDLRKNSVV